MWLKTVAIKYNNIVDQFLILILMQQNSLSNFHPMLILTVGTIRTSTSTSPDRSGPILFETATFREKFAAVVKLCL